MSQVEQMFGELGILITDVGDPAFGFQLAGNGRKSIVQFLRSRNRRFLSVKRSDRFRIQCR